MRDEELDWTPWQTALPHGYIPAPKVKQSLSHTVTRARMVRKQTYIIPRVARAPLGPYQPQTC